MEDSEQESTEQKSTEQLREELLDIIDKQAEVNAQLKEIIVSMTKDRGEVLNKEMADKVQDLFVEGEALKAEERAIFHSLFGFDD